MRTLVPSRAPYPEGLETLSSMGALTPAGSHASLDPSSRAVLNSPHFPPSQPFPQAGSSRPADQALNTGFCRDNAAKGSSEKLHNKMGVKNNAQQLEAHGGK